MSDVTTQVILDDECRHDGKTTTLIFNSEISTKEIIRWVEQLTSNNNRADLFQNLVDLINKADRVNETADTMPEYTHRVTIYQNTDDPSEMKYSLNTTKVAGRGSSLPSCG